MSSLPPGSTQSSQPKPAFSSINEHCLLQLRGTLTLLFQLCVVVGIFCAQAINIGTAQIQVWGWRLSLGLAAVPGLILLVGGLLLPETPNSLIERGYLQRVSEPPPSIARSRPPRRC